MGAQRRKSLVSEKYKNAFRVGIATDIVEFLLVMSLSASGNPNVSMPGTAIVAVVSAAIACFCYAVSGKESGATFQLFGMPTIIAAATACAEGKLDAMAFLIAVGIFQLAGMFIGTLIASHVEDHIED